MSYFKKHFEHLELNNTTYFFLLVISGLILTIPLIDTKFIASHDCIFHVTRIIDISEALKKGIFPVRMYTDHIHFWGQPVGIFYPGLFVYFPALLRCLGLPIEICYNIFIGLILFIGLFSSWYGYTLLTKSKHIGFFSALLYVSSGYYLLDAYVRSALGELLALSFMPLAVACICSFINKAKIPIKMYVIGIIAISAVIESHVLSSVFLFLFSFCYLIFKYKKINKVIARRLIYITAIVIFINASFIIPFLFFYTKVPLSIDYVESFAQSGWSFKTILRFFLLWNSWLFYGIYLFISSKVHHSKRCFLTKRKLYKYYTFHLSLGLFFLFLSSNLFPWHFFSLLEKVFRTMQFSWRFLGFSTLFFCVCGGCMLHRFLGKNKYQPIAVSIFAITICVTSFAAFNYFIPKPPWTINVKINWDSKEVAAVRPYNSDTDYLYRDIDKKKLFQQGDHYISNAVIYDYKKTLTDISFSYQTVTDSEITLPLVNYPGYVAINQEGKQLVIREDCNHMIVITLPTGNGNVNVYYKGLLLFKLADYVSLFISIVLIYYIIKIHNLKTWHILL